MTQDEYYELFDTVAAWIWYTIWGAIILASLYGIIEMLLKWKARKGLEPPKRSMPSDDFVKESRSVLDVMRERDEFGVAGNLLSEKERQELDMLHESSEFASLVRYAHYAGYGLSFEEWESRWEDDPEYLDADVFKTDLEDAASMREARRWSGYRRTFEPPRSRRGKALESVT